MKKQKSVSVAVAWAQVFLSNLATPKLEAEVLLCEVLHVSRVDLRLHPERELSDQEWQQYESYIYKRKDSIPVAYITGHKEWAGFDLKVSPNVLIPRDETEILCHHIIDAWKRTDNPHSILNVGAGSGCIELFLARALTQSKIFGLDISSQALGVARENIQRYKKQDQIELKESDMLSVLAQRENYDLIVANLPYIPEEMEISLEVQKEPCEALFSGMDGLEHIKRLKDELDAKQIRWKQLWLEFLPQQKEAITDLFFEYDVKFFPDVGGNIFFAQISPCLQEDDDLPQREQ